MAIYSPGADSENLNFAAPLELEENIAICTRVIDKKHIKYC